VRAIGGRSAAQMNRKHAPPIRESAERNAKGTVARKSLRNNPIGRETPPFIVGSASELENGT